ncbi:hypothetical protein KC19_9G055000 [Ceratodon purpureus]|uniref:Protein kinase domain-containing protein n=1 Tax=Ceratodon purpureus TaxID=3225 RepID=A0A8T0GSH9_CERPU|nr:hypothetical protein KC19_9G055000 [Ceratodon purpureus]
MAWRIALDLCIETVKGALQVFSDGQLILNTHQCQLLVKKLSEVEEVFSTIQELLSAGGANPSESLACARVLSCLFRVLGSAGQLLSACRCKDQSWLMVTLKQGDMQETFAELLHDLQWYMSVLCSILFTKFSHTRTVFSISSCNGTLDFMDRLVLSTAAKADKGALIARLKDVVCGGGSGSLPDDEVNLAEQLIHLLSRDGSSSSSPLFLNVNMRDLPDEGWIGQGCFGVVEKTTWREETFAKKTFREKLFFEQELDGYEGLNNPNVMRIIFCSEDVGSKKYALVLEYMPMDLFRYLEEWRKMDHPDGPGATTPFSITEAVDLMLQIARGLMYIHDKGKSHRDVKSLNILIKAVEDSVGGKYHIAKLTDLGLTKRTNTTTKYSTRKTNISSRPWKAPELFKRSEGERRPEKLRTPKTDVFSFAVVCSETLTGNPPWEDTSNLKSRLEKGERPQLPERTPARLVALIKRCWDLSPLLRPGFPEICQELQYIKGLLLRDDVSILAKTPVVASVMTGSEAQGPWGGEHGGTPFAVPMNESIIKIEVRYCAQHVYGLDVEYNINGKPFKAGFGRVCGTHLIGEIKIQEPIEFLTHIEGTFGTSVGVIQRDEYISGYIRGETLCHVTSLTIHTNVKAYGPFGARGTGTPFKSDRGRIVGFHGREGNLLDSIGVFVVKGEPLLA